MAQLPFIGTPVVGPDDFPFIGTEIGPFESKTNKGAPGGYAPLDANSKVPTANLPDQAALDAEVDGKITTHNSATTSVHGIANTANLVLTNDSRLADSRQPTAHTHARSDITDFAHTHAVAEVTGLQDALNGKQASGSYAPATGISPTAITGTAVITTDSRLSDPRTPTAHKSSHATGGADALTPSDIGAQPAGTYATLISGKVPSDQLPSFVDDVLEYANNSAFPATGEIGKIYVSLATNKTFRWSGSTYIEISPSEVTSVNTKTGAVTLTASDVGASPTSHTHAISDVTNLQTKLNTKQELYYSEVFYTANADDSYSMPPNSTISDSTGPIERRILFTFSGVHTSNPYFSFPATGNAGDMVTVTNSLYKADLSLNTMQLVVREVNGTQTNTFDNILAGQSRSYIRKTSETGTGKWTFVSTTAHSHGNISNTGAIGSTANLPLITTTSGVVTTGSFGTTANSFCQGNDSRISGIGAGSINTSNGGGSINTRGVGSIELGETGTRTTLVGSASVSEGGISDKTITLPNKTGYVAVTANEGQLNLGVYGGSITSEGYGGGINLGGYGGSIFTNSYGGTLDLSDHGGSITTGPYGGAINTTGQGSIELGSITQGNPSGTAFGRTILKGSVTGNSPQTITLPNATGTVALTSDSRFTDSRTPTSHSHSISEVTSLQATLTAFAIALG